MNQSLFAVEFSQFTGGKFDNIHALHSVPHALSNELTTQFALLLRSKGFVARNIYGKDIADKLELAKYCDADQYENDMYLVVEINYTTLYISWDRWGYMIDADDDCEFDQASVEEIYNHLRQLQPNV